METPTHIAQMHGDHAVVGLAAGPTILGLHPGGVIPFLGVTGLINRPDGVRIAMIRHHHLLKATAYLIRVPTMKLQKLLQRPGRHPRRLRHGGDALALQVAQLTLDVGAQCARLSAVLMSPHRRRVKYDSSRFIEATGMRSIAKPLHNQVG